MQALDIEDLHERCYCQELVVAKGQHDGGCVWSEVVFHVAIINMVS